METCEACFLGSLTVGDARCCKGWGLCMRGDWGIGEGVQYVLRHRSDRRTSVGKVLQTPVTAEDLTSLRSLIEKHTHSLDGTSKRRLQKLADAAQVSFAERALLYDENRLLFQQNNESKSSKSTVVGKAKVRNYEDIVEAQAKRAARETVEEVAKEGAAVEGMSLLQA